MSDEEKRQVELEAMQYYPPGSRQFPTGSQSVSCGYCTLQCSQTTYFDEETFQDSTENDYAKINFVKRSDVCHLRDCSAVTQLIHSFFQLLSQLKFKGFIQLDDDAYDVKKNQRILVQKAVNGEPSIYEKYGFVPHNQQKAVLLRNSYHKLCKDDANLEKLKAIEKELISVHSPMIVSPDNFLKSVDMIESLFSKSCSQ